VEDVDRSSRATRSALPVAAISVYRSQARSSSIAARPVLPSSSDSAARETSTLAERMKSEFAFRYSSIERSPRPRAEMGRRNQGSSRRPQRPGARQKSAMLRAVSLLISGHAIGITSVPCTVPMT
jgi:hypothetical protein